MKESIKELLNHFPDGQSLVYFIVDTIKMSIYGWENEMFDFCKEQSERKFWFNNITYYPYLFTAAILRYYGKDTEMVFENFYDEFHKKIENEAKSFTRQYPPKEEKHLNIIDFLYSDSIFHLSNNISVVKKIINEKKDCYGKEGYIYVTYKEGMLLEELDYNNNGGKLTSSTREETSTLCLPDCFFNVDGVISFAKTETGYIYIVVKDGKHHLRCQGFNQLSRIVRVGKQPVYVKALGNRVMVLMSDGTLTSNFGIEDENVLMAWFNENGEVKLKKEQR